MKTIIINNLQDINKITHGLTLSNLAIMSELSKGNEVILTDIGTEEIMLTTDKKRMAC